MTTYPPRDIFSSNEIHDVDTVQNTIVKAPESYFSHTTMPLRQAFPPFLLRKVVSEFIATFLLVFVSCGAAALHLSDEKKVSQLGVAVTAGLMVTVMIYSVGHISGAHMNPAVTLAFAVSKHGQFPWIQTRLMSALITIQNMQKKHVRKRIDPLTNHLRARFTLAANQNDAYVPFYWSAQTTGAIIASFALKALLHPIKNLGTTTPAGTPVQALIMEIVVTFCMMFVTSAVATDTRAVGELAGLAIGSSVCIAAIFAGPVSGGSMNPARTLGPAVASKRYNSLWVYFLGPVVGTLSGAMSYNFIRLNKLLKSEPQRSSFNLRRLQSQEVAAVEATLV